MNIRKEMMLLFKLVAVLIVDVMCPIRCLMEHSPYWVDRYYEGSTGWVMTVGCSKCSHHRVTGGVFRKVGFMNHIAFKFRWWRWFLSGPGPIFIGGRYLGGSAIDPVRIERWEAREPKETV